MDYDFRIPVFLLCNLLLVWLLQMANGVLGSHGVTVFMGGTLLIAPALFLRLRWALVVVGLTGLVQGAMLPLMPNGFLLITYAISLMPIYLYSPELRRLRAPQILLFALVVNTVMILALSVVFAQGRLLNNAYWLRILCDIAVSALVFYPVSKWFMNLQRAITLMLGDDLRAARARE